MQVFLGQGEVLGKGAVMPQQAQNPALLAVAGEAPAAAGAGSTGDIDLSHHPLPEVGGVRRPHHLPHKLVARDAAEIVVPPQYFQVGAADPRQADPHQGFAGAGLRPGEVF